MVIKSRILRALLITALGAVSVGLLMGYTTETVTDGGSVSGVVRMQGNVTLRPHQVTSAHTGVCGQTVENDDIVTGSGGALEGAVVFLDGIERGAAPTRRNITIDQNGCRYVPHIQATTRGSTLTITSHDQTLHNIHGFLGTRTLFNIAMPTPGMRVRRPLRRSGHVRMQCDAGHTWMSAHIRVFDHPYFAVTTSNGRFNLSDIPPGHYTLKVWHPRLGEQTAEIDIEAGGSTTSNLQLRAR